MGSVSNGKAIDSSANSNNHIKYIRTRSGNTIQIKDEDNNKQQEILIQTDDGNLVSISTDNSKGVIKIKSSQDIEIESDKTITVKSEKIEIKGKNISIVASEKLEMKANEIAVNADTTIKMESSEKFSAKSIEVEINATANASFNSDIQMNINGGNTTNIKASMVNIN
jgi:hypothetical protein